MNGKIQSAIDNLIAALEGYAAPQAKEMPMEGEEKEVEISVESKPKCKMCGGKGCPECEGEEEDGLDEAAKSDLMGMYSKLKGK